MSLKPERVTPIDSFNVTSIQIQVHTVPADKRWRITTIIASQFSQNSTIITKINLGSGDHSRFRQLDQTADAGKGSIAIKTNILLEAGNTISIQHILFTALDTVESQIVGEEWDVP